MFMLKAAPIVLVLLVVTSGCIGAEDFRKGWDTLTGASKEREKAEQTISCAAASITISSATWSPNELRVVVENKGDVELTGFTMVARSARETVTVERETRVAPGGVETLTLTTVNKPDDVTVTSAQCSGVSATAGVV